jgi:integrase
MKGKNMNKKPKYQITRDKFLNLSEVQKLLKTTAEHAELDLMLGRATWITRNMLCNLAIRTGLRVSEIANLKIGDLHLNGKENFLTVTRAKGNKRRDVYFNSDLAKPLKKYIEIKHRSWNHPTGPDDFLFSHQGKKYTTVALYLSFREALKRAGLPLRGIHSARHTHATLLLQATGDLQAVRRQLGHSSILLTSLYADVLPEQRQQAADKLVI